MNARTAAGTVLLLLLWSFAPALAGENEQKRTWSTRDVTVTTQVDRNHGWSGSISASPHLPIFGRTPIQIKGGDQKRERKTVTTRDSHGEDWQGEGCEPSRSPGQNYYRCDRCDGWFTSPHNDPSDCRRWQQRINTNRMRDNSTATDRRDSEDDDILLRRHSGCSARCWAEIHHISCPECGCWIPVSDGKELHASKRCRHYMRGGMPVASPGSLTTACKQARTRETEAGGYAPPRRGN